MPEQREKYERSFKIGQGEDGEGLEYRMPLGALLLVVVVGYGASLLTTFLPASQASKGLPGRGIALRIGKTRWMIGG